MKIVINMSKLSVGGMERAFINFLNMSDIVKESDTTVLIGYTTNESFLKELPKNINIKIIAKKWNFIGKIHTTLYLTLSIIKNFLFRNQFDCAISYSYQHGILSTLTRLESKNNILFIHTDLAKTRTKKQLSKLSRKVKFNRFSKTICVSNRSRKSFESLFPNYTGKLYTINNFINSTDIIEKSHVQIDYKKTATTIINVCRHENENNKRVIRILAATRKLVSEGESFQVLLIGAGKEDQKYEKYIQDHNLSGNVKMLGNIINPYPYFLVADAIIVSSSSEGYGIVLDEARVLHLPIISTDVGDAKLILEQGYGILCPNSTDGVYRGIKTFLNKHPSFNKSFNPKSFNEKINQQLNEAIKQ